MNEFNGIVFLLFTRRREFKWKWKNKKSFRLLLNCIYSTAFESWRNPEFYSAMIFDFNFGLCLVSRLAIPWINLLAYKIFFYSFFFASHFHIIIIIYEFGTGPKRTKHRDFVQFLQFICSIAFRRDPFVFKMNEKMHC